MRDFAEPERVRKVEILLIPIEWYPLVTNRCDINDSDDYNPDDPCSEEDAMKPRNSDIP